MMLVVTVAGCNRFPDNGLQIAANIPPSQGSCLFSADAELRLLRGLYDLDVARDYVIAPLLQSYLVSNALEFQAEQNNLQVDNYEITILLPDDTVPVLPGGLPNPYRVDTSAVLPATTGTNISQAVGAAIGIPASYKDALLAIEAATGFSSVILSIRAGGTTFGGFSQRSAPFRWPVDICEGCLGGVCTTEEAEEIRDGSCLQGQDIWPYCTGIFDPPTDP
jgi:hypothetical protein